MVKEGSFSKVTFEQRLKEIRSEPCELRLRKGFQEELQEESHKKLEHAQHSPENARRPVWLKENKLKEEKQNMR